MLPKEPSKRVIDAVEMARICMQTRKRKMAGLRSGHWRVPEEKEGEKEAAEEQFVGNSRAKKREQRVFQETKVIISVQLQALTCTRTEKNRAAESTNSYVLFKRPSLL